MVKLFKIGSRGPEVEQIQVLIGANADGIFGPNTAQLVAEWQEANNLTPDGVVGPMTWAAMFPPSTDLAEHSPAATELYIEEYPLSPGQYKEGPTEKEFLFLHHTAGWHDPYRVIDSWERDQRGAIATEFVIGGSSIKGRPADHDGLVLQCFPPEAFAWHLGKNGSQYMHTHSVGVELCNFGWINQGKTYTGTTAADSEVITLESPFRGYTDWHRYSEAQLESLKQLILHIANRDGIDIRKGLIEQVRSKGAAAFEFNEDAYYGRIPGMWTHTNTRKDKFDCSPQPDLLDMLLSL